MEIINNIAAIRFGKRSIKQFRTHIKFIYRLLKIAGIKFSEDKAFILLNRP